ncbi:MAG: DNA repair protein RecN [Bacillota bacterium]
MLLEMTVGNFALIERARLALSGGLNVFTGETGAGKSLLIDAVEVALGGRASTDFIRSGSDHAWVEVLFRLPKEALLADGLKELGLSGEEQVILAREIALNGRNTARVNGRLATAAMVKEIADRLVDLHGQHEHQSLLRPERHVDLLDAYGWDRVGQLREQVSRIYQEIQRLRQELKGYAGDARDRARRLDLLRFQVQEVDEARLVAGEDAALTQERLILASAEKLHALYAEAYQMLYGSDSGGSALDSLGEALDRLNAAGQIDPSAGPVADQLREALYQLQEAARELRSFRDRVDADPGRLDQIERRLDQIAGLKRKYGDTVAEILAYREQVAAEIDRLANSEQRARAIETEIKHREGEAAELAVNLSQVRQGVAAELSQAIMGELSQLGMANTTFTVAFRQTAAADGLPVDGGRVAWTATGIDQVEFLMTPNPGEPLKPLARIASGGELSRIMLAIKTILAEADGVPTLIFDEVDAGIGGRAAQAVAERLARLAAYRQVVCVSHLPQIAAMADHHFCIVKETQGGRTETKIVPLNEDERIDELARMIGGKEVTEITRRHARELLEMARAFRSGID